MFDCTVTVEMMTLVAESTFVYIFIDCSDWEKKLLVVRNDFDSTSTSFCYIYPLIIPDTECTTKRVIILVVS